MTTMLVFGGFALLQFIGENPELALYCAAFVASTPAALKAKLSRLGFIDVPVLTLATVESDVKETGCLLQRLSSAPGSPTIITLELQCTGNPHRVLRALRFGRRVASLFGSVSIDVSSAPAPLPPTSSSGHPAPPSSSAPVSFPSALGRAAADGSAWVEPAAESSAQSAARSGERQPEGISGEGAFDEGAFEMVTASRRITLEQFYFFLRPALMQIAADAADAAAAEAPASDGADAPSGGAAGAGADAADAACGAGAAGGRAGAAAGAGPDDLVVGECSICFGGRLDTVAVCGHAFCSECYDTWRSRSSKCALCRGPLPLEAGGMGSFCVVRGGAPAAKAERAAAGPGRGGEAEAADGSAAGDDEEDDGMPPGTSARGGGEAAEGDAGGAAEPPMTLELLTRWLERQPVASSP